MSTAWRDIRYAVRMLAARPGFTAVAVLTLGLGIGANTAVFSVVRSLLLEPLPFRDPDRLVMLWEATANDPDDIYIVSAPNYEDWRRSIKSFEETAIWETLNFNFSGDVEAERVPGLRVSASAFRMLGVPALMGRTFKDEEDRPGHDVAVISFGLWQRRYGGRPDIVGSVARINGRPFEIIGVMPSTFRFVNRETAVWTPIAFNEEDSGRGSHSFQAAARLRPGVSPAAAKAELDALGRSLAKQYPDDNRNETATLTPMSDLGVVQLRPTLIALTGAVALVLAIACLNVANLLLAQSASRRHEFAVRSALGASSWRIAGQVLCEALVIAMIGGAMGIAVAAAGTSLMAGVLPPGITYAPYRDAGTAIHLDPWILTFTSLVAMATGILFSLAPIAALRRTDLKAAGDRAVTGRLRFVRTGLVASEVALALIVLAAAGLMIKSLARLVTVDPGLNPTNVLLVTMALPQPDFYGPPLRERFCVDVSERVSTLPGIVSAGAVSHVPLSGSNAGRSFTVEGLTLPPGEIASASYQLTCPGYFKAMGIPLLKGRDFTARDTISSPEVVIINAETAETLLAERGADRPTHQERVGGGAHVQHSRGRGRQREALRSRRRCTASDIPSVQSGCLAGHDHRREDGHGARSVRVGRARRASEDRSRSPGRPGDHDATGRAGVHGIATFSDGAPGGVWRAGARTGDRRCVRCGELCRRAADTRDWDPRGAGRTARSSDAADPDRSDAPGHHRYRRRLRQAPSSRRGCCGRCSTTSRLGIPSCWAASAACWCAPASPHRWSLARAPHASIRFEC